MSLTGIFSSITGITEKDIVTYGSGGIFGISVIKKNKIGMLVGAGGMIYGIFFMEEKKKTFTDTVKEVWIFFTKILEWLKEILIKIAQFIGKFIVKNYQTFLKTTNDLLEWVNYFNPFNPYKNYDSSELEKTKEPTQVIAESIDKAIPRHAYDFMRKMRDEEWKMLKDRYYKILKYGDKKMLKDWLKFVKVSRVGKYYENPEIDNYIAEKEREIDKFFPYMSRDFPSRIINFYNRTHRPFTDIFKATIFKYCHFQGGLRNEEDLDGDIFIRYIKTNSIDEKVLCKVMTEIDKRFYLNLVYHALLYRDADEGGINHYYDWDKIKVIKEIYDSPERKKLIETGKVQYDTTTYEKRQILVREKKKYARKYTIKNGEIVNVEEDTLENFVAKGEKPKEGKIDDIPDENERNYLKNLINNPPVEKKY